MNKILVTNRLKYPKKAPKKGNVVVVHLLVALHVPLCERLREPKTNPSAFPASKTKTTKCKQKFLKRPKRKRPFRLFLRFLVHRIIFQYESALSQRLFSSKEKRVQIQCQKGLVWWLPNSQRKEIIELGQWSCEDRWAEKYQSTQANLGDSAAEKGGKLWSTKSFEVKGSSRRRQRMSE